MSQMADFEEFPDDAVWVQQKGEPDLAYAAFCRYRDFGPRRSLRQACKDHYELDEKPDRNSGKLAQVSEWSRTWDWVERAWAYSHHLDRLARIEAGEQAKLMVRRHAAAATHMIAKATEKIMAIQPTELTPRDAATLLDLGVKIERLSRGEATEVIDDRAEVEDAERMFRTVVADNPALALAARDLALALEGAPAQVIASTEELAADPPPEPVDEPGEPS